MNFFFAKGDEVILQARSDVGVGVITDVLVSGAEPQYKVRFGAVAQLYSARHLELASGGDDSEADPVDLLHKGELTDAATFRAFMTLSKLEKPLSDNLYSFASS